MGAEAGFGLVSFFDGKSGRDTENMKKGALLFVLASGISLGQIQVNHKFNVNGTLTGPSSQPAREIGLTWLRSSAAGLQIDAPGIAGAYLANEYRTEHNGVTHLIFKQQFRGIDVLNAEWTINIDQNGQVLNSGGTLFNAPPPD